MKITTIEQANALPGTAWVRDGLTREIDRIENLNQWGRYIRGNVYWRRPGDVVRSNPQWFHYFKGWLAKAEPANDAARAMVEAAQ